MVQFKTLSSAIVHWHVKGAVGYCVSFDANFLENTKVKEF